MRPLSLGSAYVRLLKKQEISLAELYKTFAEKIPEDRGLWNQLVVEERAHAEVLERLNGLLEAGQVSFRKGPFNTADVYEVLEHLQVKKAEVERAGIGALEALKYALAAEQSLIERGFFMIFQEEAPEIKAEFTALQEHTRQHSERIAQVLKAKSAALERGPAPPVGGKEADE